MVPLGAKMSHRGFEPEDVSALIEAHDWLSGLANQDCSCYLNDGGSISNPCDVCQARRARDALNQVIDPKPLTLHPNRLKTASERIYYELWCKENERHRAINSGYTLIEHLLHPECDFERNSFGGYKRPPQPVSQHDMTIATTVIQWLGTSCGRGFIEQAEREIEKRRAERSKFFTDGLGDLPAAWSERNSKGEVFQVADTIASNFISVHRPEMKSVHAALRSAITNAIVRFRDGVSSVPESSMDSPR